MVSSVLLVRQLFVTLKLVTSMKVCWSFVSATVNFKYFLGALAPRPLVSKCTRWIGWPQTPLYKWLSWSSFNSIRLQLPLIPKLVTMVTSIFPWDMGSSVQVADSINPISEPNRVSISRPKLKLSPFCVIFTRLSPKCGCYGNTP